MGSDARLLVHVGEDAWAEELAAKGVPLEVKGEWVMFTDSEWDAARISRRTRFCIYWSISTATDTMTLELFENGKCVRRLEYCGDQGGWLADEGAPSRFEDVKKLKAWKRRRILASPDGYAILDDFLGSSGRNAARAQKLTQLAEAHDPLRAGVKQAIVWMKAQAKKSQVYAAAFVLNKGWLELWLGVESVRAKRTKQAERSDICLRQSRSARAEAYRWDFQGWTPRRRIGRCKAEGSADFRIKKILQGTNLPRVPILYLNRVSSSYEDPTGTPTISGERPGLSSSALFKGIQPKALMATFLGAVKGDVPEWVPDFKQRAAPTSAST